MLPRRISCSRVRFSYCLRQDQSQACRGVHAAVCASAALSSGLARSARCRCAVRVIVASGGFDPPGRFFANRSAASSEPGPELATATSDAVSNAEQDPTASTSRRLLPFSGIPPATPPAFVVASVSAASPTGSRSWGTVRIPAPRLRWWTHCRGSIRRAVIASSVLCWRWEAQFPTLEYARVGNPAHKVVACSFLSQL